MPEPKVARDADTRGEGICRTCLKPIWDEGGTIGHRKRDTGWSDRIERGGDSLVCFSAIHYRHAPLEGREAEIYDVALGRRTFTESDPVVEVAAKAMYRIAPNLSMAGAKTLAKAALQACTDHTDGGRA